MFDAKKLLDAVMAASQAPGAARPAGAPGQQAAPGGDLASILGNVLGQISQTGAAPGQPAAGVPQAPVQASAAPGGSLGDLLGGLLGGGAGGAAQPGGAPAGGLANMGGLGGLLGTMLGQATQGVQGAARDVNAATGVGTGLDGILASLTGGKGSQELLNKAKDFAGQNQLATGAAMGSLATIFLGTKAGRGLAVDTAKLGGLALIGGLAYQAWKNYQAGKPPVALQPAAVVEPPAESPFGSVGSAETDQDTALLLLRAMIASASADGVIDDRERAHILGSLQTIGLAPDAVKFLGHEFARPATTDELADAVSGPEVAAEVYAAARLTIEPDKAQEQAFLADLATKLGLDGQLVAHIDAAAAGVKA